MSPLQTSHTLTGLVAYLPTLYSITPFFLIVFSTDGILKFMSLTYGRQGHWQFTIQTTSRLSVGVWLLNLSQRPCVKDLATNLWHYWKVVEPLGGRV
jgi:hypothetical protein